VLWIPRVSAIWVPIAPLGRNHVKGDYDTARLLDEGDGPGPVPGAWSGTPAENAAALSGARSRRASQYIGTLT